MPESRTGGVYVGVYSKDEGIASAFTKATASVQAFFNGVSAATSRLGGQLAGVGASISAPLTAATVGISNILGAFANTSSFAAFGSSIQDMAERTGASAELLSTLKHAADLTGGSLQSMGMSLFQMNKNIENGSKQVAKGLGLIGIQAKDLEGLSVDQKFEKITAAMAKTGDIGIQAAAGQRIFGRAAKEMMPILTDAEGMKKMREETERLGILWSGDMASSADRLGDMMGRIKDAWQGIIIVIGEQLAPAFERAAIVITNFVVNVRTLIRDNPIVAQSLNYIATALLAVGGALFAVSAASKGFEFLFSPGGIIAVGIGLIALWSGALDSFLGNWKKFVVELQVGGQSIGTWFASIGKVVSNALDLIAPVMDRSWQNIMATMLDWSAQLVDLSARMVQSMVGLVEGIINAAISGMNTLIDKASGMLTSMMRSIDDFMGTSKEAGYKPPTANIPTIGKVSLAGQGEDAAELIRRAIEPLQDMAAGRRDRAAALSDVIGIKSEALTGSTGALQDQVKTAMSGVAEEVKAIMDKITGKETPKEINSILDLVTGLFRGFDETGKRKQSQEKVSAPSKISAIGSFSAAEAGGLFKTPSNIAEMQLKEQRTTNDYLRDIAENGGQLVYEGE